MKKSTKKLSLSRVAISRISQAAGGRTLSWTCETVYECEEYTPAPGSTLKLSDSCDAAKCWG